MEKLFQKIVAILEKNGNISNEDREVYLFALHTAMIYLINIVCSIVIGILMGMPLDCIIFLIAFILLRQETGGYHAPGYKTCFLFSCIVLVLALLWVKLKVPFQTWITMGPVSYTHLDVYKRHGLMIMNIADLFMQRILISDCHSIPLNASTVIICSLTHRKYLYIIMGKN